jgi:acetamidase/formamidase
LAHETAEYAPGIVVPLRPFWGVIAVAPPAAMGRVPSGPPNMFGGNMDNRVMTMGLSPDLDEAAKIATRETLDWLVDMKGLSRENAYMLASAAMDLVVTQVVDGTKGIHALMPKAIFGKASVAR